MKQHIYLRDDQAVRALVVGARERDRQFGLAFRWGVAINREFLRYGTGAPAVFRRVQTSRRFAAWACGPMGRAVIREDKLGFELARAAWQHILRDNLTLAQREFVQRKLARLISPDKAIKAGLNQAACAMGSIVRWDWWRGDYGQIIVRAWNSEGIEGRFVAWPE